MATDTRSKAINAYTAIYQRGEKPTIEAVRKELGGKGGTTLIQEVVKMMNERLRAFAQLPDVPPEIVTQFTEIWNAAVDSAKSKVSDDLTETQQTLTEIEGQLVESRHHAAALESRLAQAQGLLEARQSDITALLAKQRELETTVDALTLRAELAEGRLADRSRDLESSAGSQQAMQQTIEQLRESLTEQAAAHQRVIATLESKHAEHFAARERQLTEQYDNERRALERNAAIAAATIHEQNRKVAALEGKIESDAIATREASAASDRARIDLASQVAALTTTNDLLRRNEDSLRVELRQMAQRIEILSAEMSKPKVRKRNKETSGASNG